MPQSEESGCASECVAPRSFWNATAPMAAATSIFPRASRSAPFRKARGNASTMRWMPSNATPSHKGWKTGDVNDSMQWVRASSPVAAVSRGGRPAVRAGSRMTSRASSSGWNSTALRRVESSVTTELRPTSLPVPAVVGTQTHGARPRQSSLKLNEDSSRLGRLMRSRHALPTSRALPPPKAMTQSQPFSENALAASTTSCSTGLGCTPEKRRGGKTERRNRRTHALDVAEHPAGGARKIRGTSEARHFVADHEVFQGLAHPRQRLGAVADLVFHFRAQFGKRLLMVTWNEKRVIAKSVLSRRLKGDASFAHTLEQMAAQCRLWRLHGDERKDAAKPGGALFARSALQQAQELGVVVGVAGMVRAAGRAGVVERRETRGVNARRAVEGVHFQPGIVRQHRGTGARQAELGIWQVGQPFGQCLRFLGRVLGQRGLVLGHRWRFGEFLETEQAERAAEDRGDLLDFVRVARREDQGRHAGRSIMVRRRKGKGRSVGSSQRILVSG